MNKPIRITNERAAFAWLWANGYDWIHIGGAEGSLVVVESTECLRCGGKGYGPWYQDGGVCYDCCGVNTKGHTRSITIKAWASREKARCRAAELRAEKHRAKAEATEAAREAGARRWNIEHGFGDVTFEERNAAQKAERREAAKTLEWVGTPKGRREFDVTIVAIPGWDSAFGYTYCYLLDDENGNRLVWKTTTAPQSLFDDQSVDCDIAKGAAIRIRATVKAHDTRDGAKQTTITRAAFVARLTTTKEAA